MNREMSGARSLFTSSARKAKKWDIQNDGPFKDKLIKSSQGVGRN